MFVLYGSSLLEALLIQKIPDGFLRSGSLAWRRAHNLLGCAHRRGQVIHRTQSLCQWTSRSEVLLAGTRAVSPVERDILRKVFLLFESHFIDNFIMA